MNSNIITAINTKENTLEFNLTIQGLDSNDVSVRLIVETENIEFGFCCSKKEGSSDVWEVTLPKLPMLEKTAYPFKITVVADGYYFEPHKGTLNLVGSQEIYSTTPKNVSLKPKKDSDDDSEKEEKEEKTEKKEVKEETYRYTKQREKPISQIAEELMKQASFNKKVPLTESVNDTNKQQKIDKVLQELGISIKPQSTRRKFKLSD